MKKPRNSWGFGMEQKEEKKSGVVAIFGKWPGNETDEEIAKALEEMS